MAAERSGARDTGGVGEPSDPGPPEANRWLFGGLFVLTTVTGVVDATSYLGLGRVFTANMTGNVLLLGFNAVGQPRGSHPSFLTGLCALLAFVAGAAVGMAVCGRRPAVPRTAAGFSLGCAVLVVGLVLCVLVGVQSSIGRNLVVAALALAMGIQNAVVRRLGLPDVNTQVLTTIVGGLAADAVQTGGAPVRAGRRVATVSLLFAGAALGALIERAGVPWCIGSALALTVAGALAVERGLRR